jgi:hypothetical protein
MINNDLDKNNLIFTLLFLTLMASDNFKQY